MWQVILDHLLTLLCVIVTPVLLAMLQKFLKTRNLPIQQDIMERVVTDSIHYAESAGHAALKKGDHLQGNEKLDAAMSYVESETTRLGLDKMAEGALTKVVEAQLSKVKGYNGLTLAPAVVVTVETPAADAAANPAPTDPEAPKA